MAIRIFLLVFLALAFLPSAATAQDEDVECMDCHEDDTLVKDRHGIPISLFIDYDLYGRSVHADEGCISCHEDVDPDDLPHEDNLARVDCSMCHDDPIEEFERGRHGNALNRGRFLAPTCATCHTKHGILPSADSRSWTHESQVLSLCASCHKESLTVAELRPLTRRERNTLTVIEDVIHGESSVRMGLNVTPTCTTCHGAHDVLSTDRAQIAETCLTCHSQIEQVHAPVFEGPSWRPALLTGPICVDCHRPHERESEAVIGVFSNATCLVCHSDQDVHVEENGEMVSLFVDAARYSNSAHGELSCVSCHTLVDRSHDPVCLDIGGVNCAMCHENEVKVFDTSQHGRELAEGNPIAPNCTSCHGTHEILSHNNSASTTAPQNVPELCAQCHREGEAAAIAYEGEEHEIIEHYAMSIHGKGLIESGLIVTATCADCHTAHRELPADDPESTVNPKNIATTCAGCHKGIYEIFQNSIHSPTVSDTEDRLPVCNDCHLSHEVSRVSGATFRQTILDQCGTCHEDVTESYFETFHGKVSYLGDTQSARCYDCHGSHNILPVSHPESTLSEANVVATCQQCHPNSNRRFAAYLTHADYHDGEKYPRLNFAFVSMTILLISVFIFFGIHTILWFPRALSERKKHGRSHG